MRFISNASRQPEMYIYRLLLSYRSFHVHVNREREKCFYLTTHARHFIYGYMASDIWWRTILIVRKETRFRHIGYSYRLTTRVLLYAPSHRQDNTYHGLCYTSRGALDGTRNSSMGSDDPSHHERTLYLWTTSRSLHVNRCRLVACIATAGGGFLFLFL